MDQRAIPSQDCQEAIYSENVMDFILPYNGNLQMANEKYLPDCIQRINQRYIVAHYYAPSFTEYLAGFTTSYSFIPKCYAIMQKPSEGTEAAKNSEQAMEAMGIGRIRRLPYLDLLGSGVLIGFLDTGIDYQHEVFRNADGSSRIYSIWDQTDKTGTAPAGFSYGAEYTKEDIDRALASNDPYSIVPEQDEDGHGTFAAGAAAGNIDRDRDFSGAAPQAGIVMVKLKQAKQYLKQFYVIPDNAQCYQETDLALGVEYLIAAARRAERPIVICMTLGTNSGGHNGAGILDEILNGHSGEAGVCIVSSTGNELGYSLHYHSINVPSGNVPSGTNIPYEEVELRIGERVEGFTMELWATSLNLYSISVVSPTGEIIGKIPGRGNRTQKMNFLFEDTRIYLDYYMVETRTGEQLILIRVFQPVMGIWKFQIYTEQEFGGTFDIWLPVSEFVSRDTYFLRSDPDITITDPGNTNGIITIASYRIADKSIYLHSGRGFTRNGRIKPDVAAPGVDIYGPLPGNRFGLKNGGSPAAALAAGACALLLEWGVVEGHRSGIETAEIKRMLKGGAEREGLTFPSPEWGFGRLDLYGAFEELRIVVNM